MSSVVMASSQSHTMYSSSIIRRYSVPQRTTPSLPNAPLSLRASRISLQSTNSAVSGGWKRMSDAFVLGKAVGEVMKERLDSVVDEFLSVIGRLQAEQQKYMSQFQEEVVEKVRIAKDPASESVSAVEAEEEPTQVQPAQEAQPQPSSSTLDVEHTTKEA